MPLHRNVDVVVDVLHLRHLHGLLHLGDHRHLDLLVDGHIHDPVDKLDLRHVHKLLLLHDHRNLPVPDDGHVLDPVDDLHLGHVHKLLHDLLDGHNLLLDHRHVRDLLLDDGLPPLHNLLNDLGPDDLDLLHPVLRDGVDHSLHDFGHLEKQESLQNSADRDFNIEIKVCNILQALCLCISTLT